MQPTTPTPMRTFLRVVVIGGIIALLVFLSIGIVKIVPRVVSSLASATVSITSLFDNNATSTNNGKGAGFEVVTNNSTTTNSTTSPNQNGTSNTSTTTSNTTTNNKPVVTNNSNHNNSNNNYYSNHQNTVVNGNPDLAVNIVSRGVINPANGAYVETANFTSNDTVVVKFKIENRGTAPSGTFNLSVQMPASAAADRLRQISNVGSIPAGAAIEAQAVFTNPQVGSSLPVTITADPSGITRDSNRTNNSSSINLNVIQGTGNNNYPNGNNTVYGQPDLIVQIVQVGTLDQFNRFIPTTNIPSNGRVAVQFKVINQGTNSNLTNGWAFRAELTDGPFPNKQYNSDIQAGLVGGQNASFTLSFDNIRPGQNSITIYTDSQNSVYENNEGNNIGSVSFNVY